MTKVKFLTKEETLELLKKVSEGDLNARETLILRNTRLVWKIVYRYFSETPYEKEDLAQIGIIGLIKAVDEFDFTKCLHLSTYAVPKIFGEITRFIRDRGTLLKIPRSLRELNYKIKQLSDKHGDLSIKELSLMLNAEESEIMESLSIYSPIKSIHMKFDTENDYTLADKIADPNSNTFDFEKQLVLEIISKLNEREQLIIKYRFFDGLSQKETANMFGWSQVHISRLERKLLDKIKNEFKEAM